MFTGVATALSHAVSQSVLSGINAARGLRGVMRCERFEGFKRLLLSCLFGAYLRWIRNRQCWWLCHEGTH